MNPVLSADVAGFRESQARRPLAPYEVLGSGEVWNAAARREAAAVMGSFGWALEAHPAVDVRPPIAWDELCSANRSWAFHLHSWDFLQSVLAGYSRTEEQDYLAFALSVALDWIANYPSYTSSESFAWYDMAVGVRARRLAYTLDVAARQEWVPDEQVEALLGAAREHARLLAGDSIFASHSNHGFFVAAGQAALARRFPDVADLSSGGHQAQQRLTALLDAQFGPDGVHREHSPDYHRMVLETFRGLSAAGLIEGGELEQRSSMIQAALAWFVQPNGSLVMFGDTPRRAFAPPDKLLIDEPALRYVVTRAQSGRPPGTTAHLFESGYGVIREGWPRPNEDFEDWSYLAQTGAFHSRVHKHADDLSFVWYDRGQEILVDAGRYGYVGKTLDDSPERRAGFWYSDPNRMFVESTRAHNTVQIDDVDRPRAGVRPYGSALSFCDLVDDLYVTVGQCPYGAHMHQRMLVFEPGRWLVVGDFLAPSSESGPDVSHMFVQRFQVGTGVELTGESTGFQFSVVQVRETLHALCLTRQRPVRAARGQHEPRMYGWVSPADTELVPTWTVGFQGKGAQQGFVTLWVFDPSPDVTALAGAVEGVPGLLALTAEWSDSGGKHHLEAEFRDEGAVPRVRHTIETS